jgi:hypothetical protein
LCLDRRAAHECTHRTDDTCSEHRTHANNESDSCAWVMLKWGWHRHV